MPHWYGLVSTASPPLLESCGGDPRKVRETLMEHAPLGASVRSIVWHKNEDVAALTVEGPAALDYLKTLEATDVVELEVSGPLDR